MKNITNYFSDDLNAPLHNSRWSYGAVSRDGERVVLRAWGFEMKRIDDERAYKICGADWKKTPGRGERVEHIAAIEAGKHGELIICTPEDRTEKVLKIKDYGKDVFHIKRVVREADGSIYAVVGGYRKVETK
jgi:hypothetical protein